ncbi:hypothetical protein EAH81_22260 [Flavobacterium pectinovorum]|uniref:Uncharacterized protein n=1 Tax=Flavobacterium pectinovorum TaxID=29533 RepID=A0A502EAW2_9FLAO|nr:hypothetical protein EAH81_22260 [Flavobacterium pectinovorum]
MKQKLKVLSVFCIFLNIIQMYFIYIIPKDDSISGPLLWLVILVPIFILQLISFMLFFVTEQQNKRKLFILALINLFLTALPFCILLKYY